MIPLCLALLTVFCSVPSAHAASGDHILIIGQQKDVIGEYIKKVGMPGGVMAYTSIQKMQGLDKPADDGSGIQHAQYYVKHYPHAVIQMGLYLNGALDDVLGGRYDANIRKLAQWIKRAKRPVYLRIGYEFDLPDNGYDPQKYFLVFRYIVDELRDQGAKNAFYVWHSAAAIEHPDFMKWYPGDEYVDWFAVSFFDPMQAKSAGDFFTLAKEHGKPYMIAESSPAGRYTIRGKKEWLVRYFDFIRRYDVKIICYINSNWDWYPLFKQMHWGDARIEQNEDIKRFWLEEARRWLGQ